MLYTRNGDEGKSNLLGRKGLSKSDPYFDALGALDELNSFIGVCRAHADGAGLGLVIDDSDFISICEELQQNLFIVQAELAGSDKKVNEKHVARLEEITDHIEKELPKITSFFLPGATLPAAHFDYARTIARKAERCVLSADKAKKLRQPLCSYLNRLSSVLYALARLAVHRAGTSETSPHY